jgi:hypothetical protein
MDDTQKIVAEAMEKIRREAYATGWRDCAAIITKALGEAQPGDVPDAPQDEPRDAKPGSRDGTVTGAPTIGTTPHYVYMAVRRKPGMTGAEVVSAVHADGHNVAEGNIRVTLVRLVKRGLIVNRHKKWYLT